MLAVSGPGDFALTLDPIVGIGADKSIIWAGSSLTVTGSVNYPGASVSVNGVSVAWTGDTHFTATIAPILGMNRITAEATLDGQTRTQSVSLLNTLFYDAYSCDHPGSYAGGDGNSPIGTYAWLGGDAETFTVNVPAAGDYQLYMSACTEMGGTSCRVSVNGSAIDSYNIPTTWWGAYGYVANVPAVTLNEGTNTIAFTCPSGGANFAYILLAPLSSVDSLILTVDQSDAMKLRMMPGGEGFGTFEISGGVNYPDAVITVNGSNVWRTSGTTFIAQPPVSYGDNAITVAASLGGETITKVVHVNCVDAYPVSEVDWDSITGTKNAPYYPDTDALGGMSVFISEDTGDGNGKIPFAVDAPEDGSYNLMLRYAMLPDIPMTLAVTVDGHAAGSFTVPGTGGWLAYQLADGVILPLTQGEHTVSIECVSGSANIDLVALALAQAAKPLVLTVDPLDSYRDSVNQYFYFNAVASLTVSGSVSDMAALVTVNGSKVAVGADGSFSAEIPADFGLNTVTVAATLGGLTKSQAFNAFNGYASIAGTNGWGQTGDFIAPDAYLPGYDPNWWWVYALQLDAGISASTLVSNQSSQTIYGSFVPAP